MVLLVLYFFSWWQFLTLLERLFGEVYLDEFHLSTAGFLIRADSFFRL
jgi:hypothetical protein